MELKAQEREALIKLLRSFKLFMMNTVVNSVENAGAVVDALEKLVDVSDALEEEESRE